AERRAGADAGVLEAAEQAIRLADGRIREGAVDPAVRDVELGREQLVLEDDHGVRAAVRRSALGAGAGVRLEDRADVGLAERQAADGEAAGGPQVVVARRVAAGRSVRLPVAPGERALARHARGGVAEHGRREVALAAAGRSRIVVGEDL